MARANVTVLQAPHNNVDWAVFAKMFQDAMKQRQAQEANQATYEGLAAAGQNTADQVIAPYADRASQTGNAVVTDQRNIDAINTPVTGAGNPDTLPNTAMLHQAMRTNTPMPETEQGSVDTKQLSKDMQPQIANLQADLHAALAGDAAAQSKLAQVKTQVGDGMWNSMSEYVKRGMPADKAYAVIMKSIESANDKVAKQEFSEIIKNMPNDPAQKESYLMKYAGNPMVDKILQPILSRAQPTQPNVIVAPNGTVIDPKTGQPIAGVPNYAKPEKPAAGTWITGVDPTDGTPYRQNTITGEKIVTGAPSVKSVDTPWGKIPVSKFIDIHKDALGGETISERKDPSTGEIVQSKTMRPAKPEILKWSQPIYDKINATPQTQNTNQSSSLGDPLMDATLAEIRVNGAEVAQGKLAAKVGEEKAKQIINQISLFLQEK